MNNDLLERISSYFNGEEDEGDRRNAEVAYWLYRSCTPGTPEYNRTELLSSKHKLISKESIIAEDYAMEHHLWFEDDGVPFSQKRAMISLASQTWGLPVLLTPSSNSE